MLRLAGLFIISGYQRYLSPRKGFHCAYGVLHQDGTCSSIGKKRMRDEGVLAFFRFMPIQFAACKAAAMTLQRDEDERRRRGDRGERGGKFADRCQNGSDGAEAGCEVLQCCECGSI